MECTFRTKALPEHEDFLRKAFDLILKKIALENGDRMKEWTSPEEMESKFDFEIPEEIGNEEEILNSIEKFIDMSLCLTHPRCFNQMFGGFDPYGMAAQWVSDSLNVSNYTYEVAPVFIYMEKIIMEKLVRLIGWKINEGDGIMTPGGSLANMLGIECALHNSHPEIKRKGAFGMKPLALFVSEEGHYSFSKGSIFMGIGQDSVYKVKADNYRKMDLKDLQSKIQQAIEDGREPFLVVATCGTTVFGAFDSLPEISEVCQQHGLWLHVDAAWGGAVIFSDKHKHLLQGIEKADSITYDCHKMMGAPLQCSFFLVKQKDLLLSCNSLKATYLFQADKFYDVSWDTGDKTIQCSRKTDIFKFWLMWKAKGNKGFQNHVDDLMEKASYFEEKIKNTEGFMLISKKIQFTNVCFFYIPPSLRELAQNSTSAEFQKKISMVAPKIKERMMKKGSTMIGFQKSHGLSNFFRFVISNSGSTYSDIDFLIEEISSLGKDL